MPSNDVTREKIETAIISGLDYLAQHQFPSGEFCCYIAIDEPMKGWCVPDSTIFASMVVAACLLPMAERPETEPMLTKATEFIFSQMDNGGVWPVFTDRHPWHDMVPYDTDSLAYGSAFMEDRGIKGPGYLNNKALMANRNSKGLFYTWFVLRPRFHTSRVNLSLSARELMRPVATLLFWKANECTRADIDLGINTNILHYLGDIEETQPIIAAVLRMIENEEEDRSDKWYLNPFTIYYLLSRAYHRGVHKLEPAKAAIINRILKTAQPDGKLGTSIMDTALGAMVMLNFGYHEPELERTINYILKAQQPHGEWPRWIFYYGGPKRLQGWGSEEITTGFCLEALARYQKIM